MRIALDCRTIKPWKTGLGRYAYALIRHLAALDRENDYIILKSPLLPQRLIAQENFRELPLAGTPEDVRNVCGHLGILDHEHVDIFHALYHFLPRSVRAGRVMITCHDLIWMDHPWLAFADSWRGLGIKVWGTFAIGRALRTADAIVCISRPREPRWNDACADRKTCALSIMGRNRRGMKPPKMGTCHCMERQLVTQLRLDPHVFLLQPSLTEGFGFPVVEAMQAGCPVIVANRASLPELVGAAGLLADPTDPAAWANAMAQLLADPALRAQCIARGHSHVQQFTWESTVQQTLDLYRSLR